MSLLGVILGLLAPSPIAAAQRAVRPNPYAPSLPLQMNVAVGQGIGRQGLQDALAGLSGSEADYALEQIGGRSDIGARLPSVRPDTVARPPSAYTPRLPDGVIGQGTGPESGGNSNKGFVTDVPGLKRKDRRWGLTGRTLQLPGNLLNGTLLNPTDRAPVPRVMQAAYSKHNPNELRLEDQYGDLS